MAEEPQIALLMCIVGFVIYIVCKMRDPSVAGLGSLCRRIISLTYRGLRWLAIPVLFTVFIHPILGLTVLGFNVALLIVRTIEEGHFVSLRKRES